MSGLGRSVCSVLCCPSRAELILTLAGQFSDEWETEFVVQSRGWVLDS